MTDPRAVASKIVTNWFHNDEPNSTFPLTRDNTDLVNRIASALADAERRVLEKVAARIIDTHRMGDRDEWLDLARLFKAQAQAGKEG